MNIPIQVVNEDGETSDLPIEPWRTQVTDPPDIRVEEPPATPYQARHFLDLKNGSRPRKQWNDFTRKAIRMKQRRAKLARRRNRKKR